MAVPRWYWAAALGVFAAIALGILVQRWQVIAQNTPVSPPQAAAANGGRAGQHRAEDNPDSQDQPCAGGSTEASNKDTAHPLMTTDSNKDTKTHAKPRAAKAKAATIPRLDLNHADSAQLQELPGVGPVLANRIVSYRNQHGAFAAYEDLDAVKGVGPKLLEKLRPYLYVK